MRSSCAATCGSSRSSCATTTGSPGGCPRAFVSLLSSDGELYDSRAFARFLEQRRASGLDLVFVVGGAFGLELPEAAHRLSLGPFRSAGFARVVILEQLYRAHKIIAGEPYHH